MHENQVQFHMTSLHEQIEHELDEVLMTFSSMMETLVYDEESLLSYHQDQVSKQMREEKIQSHNDSEDLQIQKNSSYKYIYLDQTISYKA